MRIEKFYAKKADANQVLVFYTKNDLLLPFLKNIVKGFNSLDRLIINFSIKKKRFSKNIIIFMSMHNPLIDDHFLFFKKLNDLIEETFNEKIIEISSIDKTYKLFKKFKNNF